MSRSDLTSFRKKAFLIKFIFIALTAAAILMFLFLCRIKTIAVENNSFSDSQAILDSAAINAGAHMYSIDKEAIASRIMSKNPYVGLVSVRRTLPSTLRIIVSEDKPAFYTAVGDKFYVLSENLRVLEESYSSYTLSARGIVPLLLSGVQEAVIGKKLVFDSKNGYGFNLGLVETFMSSEIAENITSIDISQRFDVNAVYKSKYTLVFSSYEDLDKKLKFCKKTIVYLESSMPGVSGTVYATGTEETSFLVTGTAG